MERVLNQVLVALIALAGMLWLFQSSETCKSIFGKAQIALDQNASTRPPMESGTPPENHSPATTSEFESGWQTSVSTKNLDQPLPSASNEEEFTAKGGAATLEEGALSYLIVTGSFATQTQASEAVLSLRKQGYKHAWLTKTPEGRFRVQAGAFTRETAKQVLQQIRKKIPDAYLKQAE